MWMLGGEMRYWANRVLRSCRYKHQSCYQNFIRVTCVLQVISRFREHIDIFIQ